MFAPSSFKLFLAQTVCWISIVALLLHGSMLLIGISLIFYVLYAGAGVALTFHRTLSHNAFKFHPIVKRSMILLSCLANVGSPLSWVAIHRAHHRFCDTPLDPHSPKYKSFWFMIFGSMYAKPPVRYVRDLLRDNFCVAAHQYYFLIQVPWIIFLYSIGGMWAVIACHLVPGGMTWLAGSFVNWFNHRHGYQLTYTKDSSTNHWLTGLLVLGEGWHNNHHNAPIQATTKILAHEFDAIYYIARLLGGKPTLKN
jgi:fatty-acid desaturase